MQPEDTVGPTVPQQEAPVAQSTVSPLPVQQPTQQQPIITPQSATPQINQTTFGANSNPLDKPKRRIPRWLKILLLLLLTIVVAMVVIYIVFQRQFTTMTYTGQNDTKFSLKFYKGATREAASALPPILSDNHRSDDPDVLVSHSGKYPLVLTIFKSKNKSAEASELFLASTACKKPPLKLRTPAPGQSNIVCHLPTGAKDYVYMYEIHDGSDRYLVAITQDVRSSKLSQDQLLDDPELDLRRHNEELQTILPSIKVIH